MITKEILEGFFDDTRKLCDRGEAQFNIDETCRWSFFFVDASQEKLQPVAHHLDALGYEIHGFLEPSESDDNPVYFLRADRVERHTVDSLNRRNQELYAIASQFGVQEYDGMDVGAIDEH